MWKTGRRHARRFASQHSALIGEIYDAKDNPDTAWFGLARSLGSAGRRGHGAQGPEGRSRAGNGEGIIPELQRLCGALPVGTARLVAISRRRLLSTRRSLNAKSTERKIRSHSRKL